MTSNKYAVVYHDIAEGGNFWFSLIDIGNDLEAACAAMFNHFDDEYQQTKKHCLMAGDGMENENGLIYFVVDLENPPKCKVDYAWLSRYYILHKEEKR